VKYFWLLVLSVSFMSTKAFAGLTIEITSGVDNPTPIAIVPFGNSNGLPEDLQAIVAADLMRSGFFRPIPKDDMLAMPKTQAEVFYRDWRMLGASYLVIGQMTSIAAGRYQLTYELYDVLSQRKVFQRNVSGGAAQLRDMAHAVADAVYESITGIRGIFSTKIVYVEDLKVQGKGRYRLVYADADGFRDRVLFSSSQPLLSPTWSHDMTKIAYVSFETSRPAIFIQELASGKRTQMTNFQGLNGAPSFSPDDKSLALVLSKDGNPEVYTMDIFSKSLRRVTNHFAIDTEPNWSVDGKSIIFTSNRGGSPQIYQVGLASMRVERLTFAGDYNARPRVSPDGKSLVVVHREDGVFHIALQDIKSGDIRVLTETLLDESPSIAPNGAMLLYATKHQNKGVLAAVSMDAGVKFRLPSKQGDVREPAWSPFKN
jgi:TolB protein